MDRPTFIRSADEIDALIAKTYHGSVDAFRHLVESHRNGWIPEERSDAYQNVQAHAVEHGLGMLDPHEQQKLIRIIDQLYG
jgi:hypothetical protein